MKKTRQDRLRQDLDLFRELAEEVLEQEVNHPVARPIPPIDLFDKLDLSLDDEGVKRKELTVLLRKVIYHAPKTSGKRFFNQLFGGRNSTAILGDLLSVMLNNSMYTYKIAGPMIGIEEAVWQKTAELINYPDSAGGTMASGGSMTNLMGLLMARDKASKNVRSQGVTRKMTVYTSEVSHYSIPKNAAFAGIGVDQVRYIKTDKEGRMLASDLENQVLRDKEAGHLPFFVNATAGTTVLGAFDPIRELRTVCDQYDLWLHVDGAYGGSVIFSEEHRHLIDGVDLSDSFCFNAHKMLNTTLSCSIVVTRQKMDMYHTFSHEANYLYQTESDDFNPGKVSLQCGRRNDALKIWTLWKSVGTKGLGAMVDGQISQADTAREYIRSHPDYTLYSTQDMLSICFNYKNIPAKELCNTLYESGQLMVGHGHAFGETFIRLVTINSENNPEDVLEFFRVLESCAEAYF